MNGTACLEHITRRPPTIWPLVVFAGQLGQPTGDARRAVQPHMDAAVRHGVQRQQQRHASGACELAAGAAGRHSHQPVQGRVPQPGGDPRLAHGRLLQTRTPQQPSPVHAACETLFIRRPLTQNEVRQIATVSADGRCVLAPASAHCMPAPQASAGLKRWLPSLCGSAASSQDGDLHAAAELSALRRPRVPGGGGAAEPQHPAAGPPVHRSAVPGRPCAR